jgi:hypothetical protein
MEMASELYTYGLRSIVQEHRTGEYNRADLRTFMRLHDLDVSEPFFWTSPRLFATIVEDSQEAGINMDTSCYTGWVDCPGSDEVPIDQIGAIMVNRLMNGQPVSLIAATVSHFKAALKAAQPRLITRPLSVTLWLLIRYTSWLRRPTRIVLRPGTARLLNLRARSVAAVIVPRKLRI